ncbi:DNA polymerase zeta processivity subunit [Drosophila rhopaloa]|uniref:Mitotic spindle assembly checkpoint protein MAD2B n=1 Tax=Drosophila rhopaloa TaxID=1041015 RepID=A0A6P4EFQ5_DRORH|nr:DNA polymerase zeta processivity subunit [Drosophila rhopaloa]
MQAEIAADIHLEAIEVLLNHILYVRGLYPSQIFKKRRVYNTPVFVSIFPPLNNYLASVLRSARELLIRQELQCLVVIVYQKENEPLESYQLHLKSLEAGGKSTVEDPHLIEFEQQLRAAIYKLSERLKQLPKLPAGSCQFKVHLHTTQDAFVRFSHESQYQEFPWLQAQTAESQPSQTISLLPLATVENVGLKMQAHILG